MPDYAVGMKFTGKETVSATMKRMGKQADASGKRMSSAFRKASRESSRFADITKGILTAGIIKGSIRTVQNQIAGVISAAKEMTAIESSFRTIFGMNAGAELQFVGKEARKLGLDLNTAARGFAQISASAKGTLIEGKGTREIFLGISEAGTALNLNAEQMGGALTALSQIMSKGKVQAEELRGQLGERIPGAFQIAARALGVTTQQLDKFMSSGKITSEVFLPRFAAQLRKEFGAAATDAAQEFNAASNRWNTSIFRMKAIIGKTLLPAIMGLMTRMEPAIKTVMNWTRANGILIRQKVAQTIAFISESFRTLRPLIESAFKLFKVGAPIVGSVLRSLIPIIQTVVQWTAAFLGALQPFMPLIPSLITFFLSYNLTLKAIHLTLAAIPILKAVAGFFMLAKSVGIAKATMILFNLAVAANPIGLIAVGIAAAVTAVILLEKKFKIFSKTLSFVWKVLKGIGTALKGFFTSGAAEPRGLRAITEAARRQKEALRVTTPADVGARVAHERALRVAPNEKDAAAAQINFKGRLDIAGAPEGSTFKSTTNGAPPLDHALFGGAL